MDVFGFMLIVVVAGLVLHWTLGATRKRCWNCRRWIAKQARVCPGCGRRQPT